MIVDGRRGCQSFGCFPTAWLANQYSFDSVVMVAPVLKYQNFPALLPIKEDIPTAIVHPSDDEVSNVLEVEV